jgi:flagellar biogenesis protein FliO
MQMNHDEDGGSTMMWMMIVCCLVMFGLLALVGFGVWSLR